MEFTIIQTSNQENEGLEQKKEGGKQGRIPSSFYQKATSHQPPKEGKKNWKKPYSSSYRIQRIQKDAMENISKIARTLMKFKDKEEQRMRQPAFPKKSLCLLMF
ncbi:hypothetical protein O181_090046 [Austropuccinia psidii MF-1]|uniref:Uncharacterized protein n=1 Tax=Austropuccinia psidii MF-1 TaxID=1389203 RepID=A0A9Q3IUM4_9BASI|nr:hypothetical protein [Austropuccinia psidii MF-1]